jgi:hypothetical protein
METITITQDQYKKLDNAVGLLHDFIANHGAEGADYAVFNLANEVLKDIQDFIDWQAEQAARSARTDAWIKQANKDIREGRA